jgi:predicted Zn-dependent protease
MSSNNAGIRVWTDRKVIGPYLPDLPWLVKCPTCSHLFWIDEAKEVGQQGGLFSNNDPKWPDAVSSNYPSEDDFFAALTMEDLDREKVVFIRRKIWWMTNDPIRENFTIRELTLTKRQTDNLNELFEVLDEKLGCDERIVKAEIARELGEFDTCVKLLSMDFPEEFRDFASYVTRLAEKNDRYVREYVQKRRTPRRASWQYQAVDNVDWLEMLIEEADVVIHKAKTDNVSAATEVETVFEAASRLSREGQYQDSEHYFVKGLQLSPWDMDSQLEYAKVLSAMGNSEKAKSVARLVLQTSERQKTLEESARLVGKTLPHHIQILPQELNEDKVICFVRIGPVEDWIIQESGKQLSEKLGTAVYIHPKQIPLPQGSTYERWSNALKEDIAWGHPYVIQQMKDIGIKSRDDATTDQTVELLARLYTAIGGDDPRGLFKEIKEQMKQRNEQWDAGRLLKTLMRTCPADSKIAYVGVTASDIYSDDTNFIFGIARTGSNFCVYSYHRYTASFNSERENQKRLLERIHKQLLSSVGFALGVGRPTDPRSARSYPNSLGDHDSKGTWLSLECIEGFEKALGHPLPERTKEESNKALLSTR